MIWVWDYTVSQDVNVSNSNVFSRRFHIFYSDVFCGMLSSGSLMAKGSLTIPDVDVDFTHLLSKLAFHAHFAQIEQVNRKSFSASNQFWLAT